MPSAASSSQAAAGSGLPAPTAGALLRMTYQGIRERQLAALIEKGFDDLNQPLLNVFLYPPPDRMRPSELAERASMTKQAMNYLLGQLEARGYIERRAERGSSRRLVFLTNRGWQVRETILAVVTEVEAEWTSVLGQRRFDEFMNTLRQLWSIRQPDVQSTDGRGVARRKSDRCEPSLSLPERGQKASRSR
jgi:DNA-binding MarR family transcriptional regulator